MASPPLAPGAADALLFDLGRVVIDIDFGRVLACWAGHAGCSPADLSKPFSQSETFRRHETGHASDAEFFEGLRSTLGIALCIALVSLVSLVSVSRLRETSSVNLNPGTQ